MSVLALPAGASAHICSSRQSSKVRVFESRGFHRACLRGHRAYRVGSVAPGRTRVAGTQFAYTSRVGGHDLISAIDLADGHRWLHRRTAGGDVARLRLGAIGALMWSTDTGGVYVATSDLDPDFHFLDGTHIKTNGNVGTADADDGTIGALRITKHLLDRHECISSYDIGFHWRAAGLETNVHTELSRGRVCA